MFVASSGLLILPLGRFLDDSVKKRTLLFLAPKSATKLFSNRATISSIFEASIRPGINYLVRIKISSLFFAIPSNSINLSVVEL